jgi:predicted Rossmann-fold nucleotide-binding protein
MPVILFGSKHWKRLIDWDYLAKCGLIGSDDLDLIHFCDKADDAWKIISDFYTNEPVS